MKRMLGFAVLGTVATLLFLGASGSMNGSAPPGFSLPACIQDQYGTQYDQLVVDSVHQIVTGVIVNPGCGDDWSMVGSYTIDRNGPVILELSGANNDGDTACVPIYKLKGAYPSANWFYNTGFQTNQPFKYAACSAPSERRDTGSGGMFRPEPR